jgi:hypothetical protein
MGTFSACARFLRVLGELSILGGDWVASFELG